MMAIKVRKLRRKEGKNKWISVEPNVVMHDIHWNVDILKGLRLLFASPLKETLQTEKEWMKVRCGLSLTFV